MVTDCVSDTCNMYINNKHYPPLRLLLYVYVSYVGNINVGGIILLAQWINLSQMEGIILMNELHVQLKLINLKQVFLFDKFANFFLLQNFPCKGLNQGGWMGCLATHHQWLLALNGQHSI